MLGKVSEKVEKTKGVRQKKKDKVKEKIQAGEYLPKEVYEVTRKAKLEILSEKMKKEGKKLNLGKSSEKRQQYKDKSRQRDGKDYKRPEGTRDGKPFVKKDFKGKDYVKKDGDNKKPYVKGEKKFDKPYEKKSFNDKVKFGKSEGSGKPDANGKKLHPSWEAKKLIRDQETHVKFTQNEVFEF